MVTSSAWAPIRCCPIFRALCRHLGRAPAPAPESADGSRSQVRGGGPPLRPRCTAGRAPVPATRVRADAATTGISGGDLVRAVAGVTGGVDALLHPATHGPPQEAGTDLHLPLWQLPACRPAEGL